MTRPAPVTCQRLKGGRQISRRGRKGATVAVLVLVLAVRASSVAAQAMAATFGSTGSPAAGADSSAWSPGSVVNAGSSAPSTPAGMPVATLSASIPAPVQPEKRAAGADPTFAIPALLPRPAAMTLQAGPGLEVGPATTIHVPRGDEAALAAARWLQGELADSAQWHLTIRVGGSMPAGAIDFATEPATAPASGPETAAEAYRLTVTSAGPRPAGLVIRAEGSAGLFYGAVSVWQLLTPHAPGRNVQLAAMTIADHPRFAWRGLMIDSARHMQSVAYIEHFINWMALHKFNTLHWHLTDDQGWRIPIAGMPRLTTVGAWRKPVGPDARDMQGHPLARYGGFYTAAQIRAVVAFAAARHIRIVPELDMPGHATALLAAYPRLAVPGILPEPVTADYGLLPGVLNVDEPTIATVEHILIQVMALFPGRYIHLGGDEVDKSEWHGSPQVQARMRALGLADEDSLERWFIGRLGSFLEAHGRRLVGWDEIQNGTPGSPQDHQAVIMTWHNGPGAAQAILTGHQAIMAQAPLYYLDNRQTNLPTEPPGWTDIETTRAIYLHDPVPPGLSPAQAGLVLGVQGQMWTERARKQGWITRQVWPRAAALAEVAWSPAIRGEGGAPAGTAGVAAAAPAVGLTTGAAVDTGAVTAYDVDAAWADFARRLAVQRARYRLIGLIDGQAPQGATSNAPDAITVRASGAAERASRDLDFCAPGTTGLVVEAPRDAGAVETATGVGPLVKFSIRQLCWAWRGAVLDGVGHMDLALVHLPFNERLGSSAPILHLAPPKTPEGEVEVHLDRIDGPLIGSLPLAGFAPGAAHYAGSLVLGTPRVPGPGETSPASNGRHDLYFVVTGTDIDTRLLQRPPVTLIASVRLR